MNERNFEKESEKVVRQEVDGSCTKSELSRLSFYFPWVFLYKTYTGLFCCWNLLSVVV